MISIKFSFQKPLLAAVLFLLTVSSYGQSKTVTLSGSVKDGLSGTAIPYANVTIKSLQSGKLAAGTVTDEEGVFNMAHVTPGNYSLQVSSIGYVLNVQELYVGSLSDFLNIGIITSRKMRSS